MIGLVALALLAVPLAGRAQPAGVTIAVGGSINTLDPHNSVSIGTDLSVASHIYDSLVLRGPDLVLRPGVATRWAMVDPTTWRFTLRDGVRFADGEALDADAVRWNIERARDPKRNTRVRPWFDLVSEVRVISPTELEIRTGSPYPALADQLSMFFLLPPRWSDTHYPATQASGSGPYELVEAVAGNRVVLRARPGYWGAAPAIPAVRFRVIPEAGARVASVLAGEADLATDIPPADIARIRAGGRAGAGAVDSTRTLLLKFNMEKAPLGTTPALRRALNLAVDRQGIIDTVWSGQGHVSACQALTPAYFGYNPALRPTPYDPAEAKRLLREANIAPGGVTLDLDVPVGMNPLATDVAKAVASQIEEIGVHVRLREMEFGAWQARYLRAHDLAPMAYMGLSWPTLDADGLLSQFQSGPSAFWSDEPFSKLMDRARAELDVGKRRAFYAEATQRMCDEAPALFLFTQPTTYATSRRVTWSARGDDWLRASDLTLRP